MRLKSILTAAALLCSALGVTSLKAADLPGVALQPESYFYTGKPYDKDLEAYTFAFRNYDPKLGRWTTADPSGFPDGANSHFYAPIPTNSVDITGLKSVILWELWVDHYNGTFSSIKAAAFAALGVGTAAGAEAATGGQVTWAVASVGALTGASAPILESLFDIKHTVASSYRYGEVSDDAKPVGYRQTQQPAVNLSRWESGTFYLSVHLATYTQYFYE